MGPMEEGGNRPSATDSLTRTRVAALQATSMFGAVRDEIVACLLERAVTVEVGRDEAFFEQGDRGTSAFLLEHGRVAVVKSWRGKPRVLRHLEPGDCFGEVALLDFGPRSASVLAVEASRALEIGARDLRAVAEIDPEQFAMIYMNLGRELSRRLRAADERLFEVHCENSEPQSPYVILPV